MPTGRAFTPFQKEKTPGIAEKCEGLNKSSSWLPAPATNNVVPSGMPGATRARLIAQRERLLRPIALPERAETLEEAVTDGPPEANPVAVNDVVPSGMPGATLWSAPAGAKAPSDAGPVLLPAIR